MAPTPFVTTHTAYSVSAELPSTLAAYPSGAPTTTVFLAFPVPFATSGARVGASARVTNVNVSGVKTVPLESVAFIVTVYSVLATRPESTATSPDTRCRGVVSSPSTGVKVSS